MTQLALILVAKELLTAQVRQEANSLSYEQFLHICILFVYHIAGVFSRVMNYVQNQCKADSELEQEDIDILERSCKFLSACMKRKPAV